jgi:hypothetical protein
MTAQHPATPRYGARLIFVRVLARASWGVKAGGQPKTHLAHVLTVAINLQRIDAWLTDTPSFKARHSKFARLMAT